jgi:hypothetical protein
MAQVRARATRRGMGWLSRYGFWARPAIFGRGPKARPSTVDFFFILVFIYLNPRKSSKLTKSM